MPAFYRASATEFIHTPDSEITGRLALAYAHSGFSSQRTSQTRAWEADLSKLKSALKKVISQEERAADWIVLLEFPIPRKEKRIDVVLLAGDTIMILELKTSSQGIDADRQAEEYALLLHFFHEPSNRRRIVTFVVSPSSRARTRMRSPQPRKARGPPERALQGPAAARPRIWTSTRSTSVRTRARASSIRCSAATSKSGRSSTS